MSYRHRISTARSADEVLAELGKCVDYVNCEPVSSLLPNTLRGIALRDARDVIEWQERIARVVRALPPVSATERFWLDLLDELFKGARQRLQELDGTICRASGHDRVRQPDRGQASGEVCDDPYT